MTREQLLSNLGTIARSGTRKFMEAVKEAKGDANLIGQFGVGFYSAFLVADRVTVYTKSHEEAQQWVWESNVGSHQYTIKEDDSGDNMVRGTRVVLHLKVGSVWGFGCWVWRHVLGYCIAQGCSGDACAAGASGHALHGRSQSASTVRPC